MAEEAAPPDIVLAFLQPLMWRPLPELLVGVPRLIAAKWFVPDGGKMAGDGGSFPVESAKGLIAFLVYVLGFLVQMFRAI
jgi:hypothetical protein